MCPTTHMFLRVPHCLKRGIGHVRMSREAVTLKSDNVTSRRTNCFGRKCYLPGPPKIGGEVCWAGRAKSSDWDRPLPNLPKFVRTGYQNPNFLRPSGHRRPKQRPARAQIRSDPDRPGCQRGQNSFGCRQTLSKHRAKFVRTGQHTSPPIFGGPYLPVKKDRRRFPRGGCHSCIHAADATIQYYDSTMSKFAIVLKIRT